jgi:hypothetical protein
MFGFLFHRFALFQALEHIRTKLYVPDVPFVPLVPLVPLVTLDEQDACPAHTLGEDQAWRQLHIQFVLTNRASPQAAPYRAAAYRRFAQQYPQLAEVALREAERCEQEAVYAP